MTKKQIFDEEHKQFLREEEERQRLMAENRKKFAVKGPDAADISQSGKLHALIRRLEQYQV